MDIGNIASYIDHTLLKPTATKAQIETLCEEASVHQFASVCVNPYRVPLAVEKLKTSPVKVCTVIGFPLGAAPKDIKVREAEWCLEHGAKEIDMVINIGDALDEEWDAVHDEIQTLAASAHANGAILKVIFETCFLSDDQIIKACQASASGCADFVKTSTGFGTGGATIENVRLMSETVAGKCQVKASGGIRDRDTAIAMIRAGATRLGTSSGVAIVKGETTASSY